MIDHRVFPDSVNPHLVEGLFLKINTIPAPENFRVFNGLEMGVDKESAILAYGEAGFGENR